MTTITQPKRTTYWHKTDHGKVQCDLCPHRCQLQEGQRGLCYIRGCENSEIVLHSWGKSSGFCIDPIEKKPLNHYYPGHSILSFGTTGCNLACKFCQNWDISKAREAEKLSGSASPEQIAEAAAAHHCQGVAFTYNDPVIFMEFALAVAAACHARNLKAIAVSAGYICPEPRDQFFRHIDAANIDLKAFTESFYKKTCGGHLHVVLDTLLHIKHEQETWLEITNLLIPGLNDSTQELEAMCRWIYEELGPDVPIHFTAFHPDYKMNEIPSTPASTLLRAREIALNCGIHYPYAGNISDRKSNSTYCPNCGATVISRIGYNITGWKLTPEGNCTVCSTPIAGVFPTQPGEWGAHREILDIKKAR